MKKKFKFVLSLIMILSMIISLNDYANANTNYDDLFNKVIVSDEAASEELSVNLGDAFSEDPLSFKGAASQLTDNNLNKVCLLLVSDFTYKNYGEFKKTIEKIEGGNQQSQDYKKVIDCIKDTIKLIDKNNTASSEPSSLTKANIFNPDIILDLIKVNLDLNNYEDEEFNETITNAFKADPDLFVKTISSLPDSDLLSINKSIAKDCAKKNIKSIDIVKNKIEYSELTTRENKILSTILYEIDNTKTNDNIDLNATIDDNIYPVQPNFSILASATPVPTIGTMTYITAPLYMYEIET
jgi:hypothetical protein